MAKGQKRSTREKKKPKADKKQAAPAVAGSTSPFKTVQQAATPPKKRP